MDRLPTLFSWVILDSPPLLFAADANLLSTLCHGTLLVVRIGHTTIDSVTQQPCSLCATTTYWVIVVNAARRGELYSKYTYYHSLLHAQRRGSSGPVSDETADDCAGKRLRARPQANDRPTSISSL